jgi:hypothetical protein
MRLRGMERTSALAQPFPLGFGKYHNVCAVATTDQRATVGISDFDQPVVEKLITSGDDGHPRPR